MLCGDRGKIWNRNCLPGVTTRWLDLKEQVCLSEPNFSLVGVWWEAVFVGNVGKVVELGIERVGDVHHDLVLLVPQELGVPIHGLSGSPGIKLRIQNVPVSLLRGEHSHNILNLNSFILHLKLEVVEDEEFHGMLDVRYAVNATDIINISSADWLKPNGTLSSLNHIPQREARSGLRLN